MENLVDKKCVPHGRIKLLTQGEIKDYFSQLKTGWLVRRSLGEGGEFIESNKIVREFKFGDFVQAMKFVNQIAEIAESEGHHPDIAIHYNKVEVTLWTHFVKGLSENDFIMASKIDNL